MRQSSLLSSVTRLFGLSPALGLACALSAVGLRAASLYVPNFSFESPVAPVSTHVDSWQKEPQPPTFDTNTFGAWDNFVGLFQNTSFGSPDYIDNAAGNQLAYLFAYPQAGMFQDYNSTDWSTNPPTHAFNSRFEVGKSYRLSVGLTSSTHEPLTQGSTLQLSLYYRDALSNMITVASATVTYDTNVFTNITHLLDFQVNVPAVQSNQAWAGQNIGIQFMSTVDPSLLGGVWDLDNVRLLESINIPNYSFESQPTALADPRVDSWQKAPQPTNFDTNTFGAWDNLAGVFTNSPSNPGYIDNADAHQLGYLFAYPQVALFQDLNTTDWSNGPPTHAFNARFKPGRAYKLAVGLTSSTQEPLTVGSTLQLSLYYRDALSNMVTVAATTVTYDPTVFSNLTHLLDFQVNIPIVNAADPWAGQNIGIAFQSVVPPALIGGVWDLDNVRLTETVANALTTPTRTAGQFHFTLQSEPGLAFDILAHTNVSQSLANWTNIMTVTNVSGATALSDTGASFSQRYYRARLRP